MVCFFIVLRSFAVIIHHIRKNHRTFRRNSATKTDSYEFIAGYHTQTSIIHDYACKCYVSHSHMKISFIHSFIIFSSWHSLKSITTLRADNQFFSDLNFFFLLSKIHWWSKSHLHLVLIHWIVRKRYRNNFQFWSHICLAYIVTSQCLNLHMEPKLAVFNAAHKVLQNGSIYGNDGNAHST